MWWEWYFIPIFFLPQTHKSSLEKKKKSHKSQLRDIQQNTLSVLLKTVKVIEKPCKVWETVTANISLRRDDD